MRKTRSPEGPGSGLKALQTYTQNQFNASLPFPQDRPLAEAALDRLARFRTALDRWHTSSNVGQMPQPEDYSLNLPPLDPVPVLCGGRP